MFSVICTRFTDLLAVTGSLLVLVLLLAALFTGSVDYWVYLTKLGEEEFYLIMGVFVYFFTGDFLSGLLVLSSIVLSGSLNVFLKYLFNTPRPVNPLVEASGPGFPSGHVQVSSSFWSSVILVYRRMSVLFLGLIIVTGVSLSRVFLRAHFAVDVVGGLFLGLITGVLCYFAFKSPGSRFVSRVVLLLFSVFTGVYDLLVLGVEFEAVSALLGLSVSLLACYLLFRFFEGFKGLGLTGRFTGFVLASTLLVLVHYASTGFHPLVRVSLFASTGFIALGVLPLLLHRLGF